MKTILTKICNFLRKHWTWLIIFFTLFVIAAIVLFAISYYSGGNESLVFWGRIALTISFSFSLTISLNVSISLVKMQGLVNVMNSQNVNNFLTIENNDKIDKNMDIVLFRAIEETYRPLIEYVKENGGFEASWLAIIFDSFFSTFSNDISSRSFFDASVDQAFKKLENSTSAFLEAYSKNLSTYSAQPGLAESWNFSEIDRRSITFPEGMENSSKWMADADNTCGEMLTDYQHFYDSFFHYFQTMGQEDVDKALKNLSK